MPSVGESMLSAAMVLLYKWINRSGWGSQNQGDLAPQSRLGRDFPRLSWLARSHPTPPASRLQFRTVHFTRDEAREPSLWRIQFMPSGNLSSPPFILPVKQDPSS